jgi:predicted dehydrogenase/GNAT superfamily N-acetyltransferase
MQPLKIGIVGACGRGASFKLACDAHGGVRIQAVCDINAGQLHAAAQRLGALEEYTDYETMLAKSPIDAVIIGTPMHFHVPQAVAALKRGIHVLSEVPAGVSLEECRKLVLACRRSHAVYMMAENYTYMKPNAIVGELVRRGLMGSVYYAEGEYIHELKELNEQTPWRRRWQTGVNGVTYGTHSLGPILQWMAGDRVVSVCCAGSGHHYRDPRGVLYENEDSDVMLCKMRSGGLVKIRVDMLSDRPHAMTNYQLQGTDGSYESARAEGERNRIWLRSLSKTPTHWTDLQELEKEFLPASWREAAGAAEKAGHGGGDYFEILDFVDAALGKRPPPFGIDAAMDMTLPGLCSQVSIAEGGRWVDVPDSRTWTPESTHSHPQLQMIWPKRRLKNPPTPKLPKGYVLREYQSSDEAQYIALLSKAGFDGWNSARVQETLKRVLPDGFFVVEHAATHTLVATAMATHNPSEQLPYGGELGWVAADPSHKGKGLGLAVCAAVTALYIRRGYQSIYLRTDDWRLAGIKTYLKLGYEPFLYEKSMQARWKKIQKLLR